MFQTVVVFLIFFTSVYSNQMDNKSLRRRCDTLGGTTCTCIDPLAYWKHDKGQILEINEIYHGKEKIMCYIIEFINHTNHYELVSDAQDCKNLEEYTNVKMEPALFPTFRKNGIFLRAINCEEKISQYIRICYYTMDYIKPISKMIDETNLEFKKGNLLKDVNVNNISTVSNKTFTDITATIVGSNSTGSWSDKCSYLLLEYDNRKICYVPIVKYFKRTESMHYNLGNKMCSKKFPWISARIRNRKQISRLRAFTECYERNEIHLKHVPILIGLIHMRGMGFIWTSGNNGSYLNSWNSDYDKLYNEMPFWIDPTFHPYLNTTEIHCHRFVIWTR
ncbi:hypothetical protein LOAG_04257 [Loa loa]|uniref:C-type lectin domain-containing protein n=1 Tax=Loa loa TaxID=7209 RepID=A0A1S0U294_LOALO|nr:hypothetical protein LOAG_04257 [Loa loa]EFO24226.1 hypothetical protein LOAG_04257 [Loa loa]